MAVVCALILVGISVISACGQKSSDPAPAPGSAVGTTVPRAALSAPERPALVEPEPVEPPDELAPPPAVAEAPPPQAPADTTKNPSSEFDRQTRDPTWAGRTEVELQKRVTTLGARVDSAECRHDRCKITLRAPEGQMTDVLAKLESRQGLVGFAESIYLTAPVQEGGKLVVRAYATFDR